MVFVIVRFAIFLTIFTISHAILSEKRRQYDDDSSENYAMESELSIPNNAQGITRSVDYESVENQKRLNMPPKYEDDRSLCFCNYDSEYCGAFSNWTCIKHIEAACFHFTEEVFNDTSRKMETLHLYGCAPLTRGSGGSYFTCKAHLTAHARPKSIACCYEGAYCNANLTVPPYKNVSPEGFIIEPKLPSRFFAVLIIFTVVFCLAIIVFLMAWWKQDYLTKKLKPLKRPSFDILDIGDKSPMLPDISSGSGSGFASLNQRTVAQNLHFLCVIGKGRYGEVKKALYRGDRFVAVKTFYTTEEDSWKNEKEIYQTQMLNHENILQFVAADIGSEDSITRMLLITDYHEFGSLFEYLQRGQTLSVSEALHLAHSAACGIEHLHSSLRGTGTPQKPAIAHRDIKSKNIIVKRPGVCCIADFGLALSDDMVKSKALINIQVGTKRYMAPEVLDKTLNSRNFHHFKMADIYSFALVIWEILRRIQEDTSAARISGSDSGIGCSGSGSSGASAKNLSSIHSVDSWNASVKSGLYRPRTYFPIQTSISSDDTLSVKARPAVQPFDGIVDSDPSVEQMRCVVCVQGQRPFIEESWTRDPCLNCICVLMGECWSAKTESRHTALRMMRTIKETIKKHEQIGAFQDLKTVTFETSLSK